MRFTCSLFWIMIFNGPALKVLNLCMSIALRNATVFSSSLNIDSLSSVILLDLGSQSPLSLTFHWWFLNLWMWVESVQHPIVTSAWCNCSEFHNADFYSNSGSCTLAWEVGYPWSCRQVPWIEQHRCTEFLELLALKSACKASVSSFLLW